MAAQTDSGVIREAPGFWKELGHALIIARREVIDMFRDWRIIGPIVVLTAVFPTVANWGAGRMIQWVGEYGAEIVGERLIPFLLMVVGFFPISFSLIIALETFVGEKERFSLEPLLSSPLTNMQLYIGKMLSSTVPPITGSLLGITVYLIGVYFNVGYVPPFMLLVQILLLNIVQAVLMVAGAVIISTQTTSVRAANLLASFIIIPMAFLIQAEALIMFWAAYGVLWWILLGLVFVVIVLIRMGVEVFNREQLLGKEIDDLNLIQGLRDVWIMALGRRPPAERRGALSWLREEIWPLILRLLPAMAVFVVMFTAALLIGQSQIARYPLPDGITVEPGWHEDFIELLAQSGLSGLGGVWRVFYQNVRALLLATGLALFSFGVLAVLVLMIPFAIIGYLLPQMAGFGIDPIVLWAALAPHGWLELTAALIAGAAALRLGASIIAPPPGKTVIESLQIAAAEALRLWVVIILPFLLLAAFAEVFLTPWIVIMLGAG